ncbi:hypothetical protein CVT25_000927, partial [Psilocybe cyanescens]
IFLLLAKLVASLCIITNFSVQFALAVLLSILTTMLNILLGHGAPTIPADFYCDAATQNLADSSFDLSGLRSSELLCLPYYDATKHLPIDPMHNLFLGLIKEHFQNILGCKKIPKEGLPAVNSLAGRLFAYTADNLDTDIFTPTQMASVRRLEDWLKQPLQKGPDIWVKYDETFK